LDFILNNNNDRDRTEEYIQEELNKSMEEETKKEGKK
jgi:hypothetical protein